jgi:hypothetical protein
MTRDSRIPASRDGIALEDESEAQSDVKHNVHGYQEDCCPIEAVPHPRRKYVLELQKNGNLGAQDGNVVEDKVDEEELLDGQRKGLLMAIVSISVSPTNWI